MTGGDGSGRGVSVGGGRQDQVKVSQDDSGTYKDLLYDDQKSNS